MFVYVPTRVYKFCGAYVFLCLWLPVVVFNGNHIPQTTSMTRSTELFLIGSPTALGCTTSLSSAMSQIHRGTLQLFQSCLEARPLNPFPLQSAQLEDLLSTGPNLKSLPVLAVVGESTHWQFLFMENLQAVSLFVLLF